MKEPDDSYLWDRSGQPDPEVERLELLLSRLRSNRPAPEMPARVIEFRPRPFTIFIRRFAVAAAMAALVVSGAWLVTRRPRALEPGKTREIARGPRAAWDVARLEGAPRVGSGHIGEKGRLEVGQWLETDASSRARINVGAIGQVQVEPNTRVRLLETRLTEHRLALQIGTIHAMIWAPPRLFFVETPSAQVVDLGCAYTLEVDDSGAGLVRVTSGWVGFELRGRESFIPAGAFCATRPGTGPGTPYFHDASQALQAALRTIDFESSGDAPARAAALDVVLAQSRKRDALSLWHLLARLSGTERERVYQHLAALVPPPRRVTREGILNGDKEMLDLWWDALGLGNAAWWRIWKGPYPGK